MLLLMILLLLLIFALPTWPYSAGWGYYPSGIFGLLLEVCNHKKSETFVAFVRFAVRSVRSKEVVQRRKNDG